MKAITIFNILLVYFAVSGHCYSKKYLPPLAHLLFSLEVITTFSIFGGKKGTVLGTAPLKAQTLRIFQKETDPTTASQML